MGEKLKRITIEEVESLRDVNYYRTPYLQVQSIPQARVFVERNGLVFAFKAKSSELPCLWHAACGKRNPVLPVHVQRDPFIGLVWRAKDELAFIKSIYYGKALRKTPTMMSLEIFRSFYATKGYEDVEVYRELHDRGEMTVYAKRIMDALFYSPPLTTRELKTASGLSDPQKRSIFDRAVTELQELLLMVKIAEEYDPFTYVWGRLDRWLNEEVKAAHSITPEDGMDTVLKKYFSRVVLSNAQKIESLFKWQKVTISSLLQRLIDEGIITEIAIENIKGSWFLACEYL